ncbi:MAG TPA: glutamine--fructose-6-phosphate transaminase (isomerizing) [Opitutales bacterium]|nr:glutamine--fructose-6-phosphate transaminase (isomerizing) [Opitutales bacterium]
MCGIIGYTGKQEASPILLDGLQRLEYRGYDSAGVALCPSGDTHETPRIVKKAARVEMLSRLVKEAHLRGTCGIGHTRWATHGKVNDVNAHPHASSDGEIVLAHNGVIENYAQLRDSLKDLGYTFQSETDTEVLANLIAMHYARLKEGNGTQNHLEEAVRHALSEVEGTYGIAVICADYPGLIVGARKGSPLVLGVGRGENMIASDTTAFAGRMPNVVYLEDGQLVRLDRDNFSISTLANESVAPVLNKIVWRSEDAELGKFPHFMLKEIFDQPASLENAMRGRFSQDASTAQFGGLNMGPRELRQVDRILMLGCGTAWHACLIAKHMIEKYARIPVDVDYASEFRYRNPPLEKNTLVFTISQSGETLDTLEAQREAKRKGYRVLSILNVVGSTMARENDGGIYQHSGPEIGVASTKAFTAQVLVATMLALYFGRTRDMSFAEGREMVKAFQSLPALVCEVLANAANVEAIAKKYAKMNDFLFLGRLEMFPVALEGALKLKEISYIHAEGYPAAEMKHGPIALICPKCPTLALAMRGEMFKKSLSSIQEVKARKGPVIAMTNCPSDFPQGLVDEMIVLPQAHDCIQPILATIPLQLLSYYIAVARGCDVDKPRNLAKSVTVE